MNYFYERPINDIDEKMINLYKQLEDMSETNFINCLKQFIQNYDFIDWIRKTTKSKQSDIDELKN